MAQIWSRLGAKVTVVEYLDRILPRIHGEIAKSVQRLLARQGVGFTLNTAVGAIVADGGTARIKTENRSSGVVETLEADEVLVAIGRRPRTAGRGLEALGLQRDVFSPLIAAAPLSP